MSSDADSDREVLRAVVASIEPLPHPGGRDPAAVTESDLTAPWQD